MHLAAIIILGPGQLPDGTILTHGNARIDVAYQKFINLKKPPYVILSGGKKAYISSEAAAMRDIIKKQYPKMLQTLLLEELSIDTLQNAFFTKVIHVDPLGIKRLSIATNAFHMPRSKQIFTNLFDDSYYLEFLEADDPPVDEKNVTNQRMIEKSAMEFNENILFCKNISENIKKVHSLIFDLDPNITLAYNKMIENLRPCFM